MIMLLTGKNRSILNLSNRHDFPMLADYHQDYDRTYFLTILETTTIFEMFFHRKVYSFQKETKLLVYLILFRHSSSSKINIFHLKKSVKMKMKNKILFAECIRIPFFAFH